MTENPNLKAYQYERQMIAERLGQFLTAMTFLVAAIVLLLVYMPGHHKSSLEFPYFMTASLGLIVSLAYLLVNMMGEYRIKAALFNFEKADASKPKEWPWPVAKAMEYERNNPPKPPKYPWPVAKAMEYEKGMPMILGFFLPSSLIIFWLVMIGHGIDYSYGSPLHNCLWRVVSAVLSISLVVGIYLYFCWATKYLEWSSKKMPCTVTLGDPIESGDEKEEGKPDGSSDIAQKWKEACRAAWDNPRVKSFYFAVPILVGIIMGVGIGYHGAHLWTWPQVADYITIVFIGCAAVFPLAGDAFVSTDKAFHLASVDRQTIEGRLARLAVRQKMTWGILACLALGILAQFAHFTLNWQGIH